MHVGFPLLLMCAQLSEAIKVAGLDCMSKGLHTEEQGHTLDLGQEMEQMVPKQISLDAAYALAMQNR